MVGFPILDMCTKLPRRKIKKRCQGSLTGVGSANSNKRENCGAKTGINTNTIKH